jgi:predicted O-methyltransferase YrrM
LRKWVTREGTTQTIEIGLGYGFSALFIGEALLWSGDASARHVVLDPNQSTRFAGCGLRLLEEAGLGRLVEFHAEESQTALPRFLTEERKFDLAFVDRTTASTESSLIWSTSASSCAAAGSCSSTTASSPRLGARPRSS